MTVPASTDLVSVADRNKPVTFMHAVSLIDPYGRMNEG
jgi:hypothetical protein